MTRRNHQLLTIDEARDRVGRAAIALADALGDQPARLKVVLTGTGTGRGLPLEARTAVRSWRDTVADVRVNGLSWILDDEIRGALSYAQLDSEELQIRAA